ncbi:unnamed protein product [Aureobasidium pullulans]|nr:unnamed protein product [Aureobasidium pullulans]
MPSSSVLLSIDVPEVSRQHGCSVRGPTRAHCKFVPEFQWKRWSIGGWYGPEGTILEEPTAWQVLQALLPLLQAPTAMLRGALGEKVISNTGILEVLDKHRNTQSGLVWYLLLATKIKGSKGYLQGHRQIASPCKACLADIRDQKNMFEELLPWAEYKGQEPTVQHDRYRDTGNIWKHRSENRMFEERHVLKARVVLRHRMCLMIEADQVDSNNT